MSSNFHRVCAAGARRSRASLFRIAGCSLLCFAAWVGGQAQPGASPAGTQFHDNPALRPPAGARVAIVEFDDLECPACAHANPLLKAAAAKYKIPWMRHDLLIPYHNWSRNAAIRARWFDTRSKALGDEYRDQVFANQAYIYTPMTLSQFTEEFAQSHGLALPFAIDPQGKLAAEVQADNDLGKTIGVTLTPTILIVTSGSKGAPFVQVLDLDRDLYRTIDEALAETAPAKPTRAGHK